MKICWCEQGGVIEDRAPLTDALHAADIDYYRYNWRHGADDPHANVQAVGRLSWSMGRSVLYEHARRGAYDYYVFADDDVLFKDSAEASVRRLREELERHRPLTACLASKNWHDGWRRRVPGVLRAPVHPYLLADLEVQILSRALAERTFPCLFDGGWGTLWYPNVAVGLLAPRHQLQFNAIRIRNGRRNESGYYGGAAHQELAPKILAATVNDELPRPIRAAIGRYGMQTVAKLGNALLSVYRARPGAAPTDAAQHAIDRYFARARALATDSPDRER